MKCAVYSVDVDLEIVPGVIVEVTLTVLATALVG